jgi:membrane-associated protease RseP (regulator of RpoE activity)
MHDLLVSKEGMGRSSATVDVRNGQTVKVPAKLKLSLAALDLRSGLREDEGLVAALKGTHRYNLVATGSGIPAEVADRVRLELESSQGRGLSERTLKDLFQGLKVELIALVIPASALGEEVEFQLYSPMHPEPDRWRLPAAGSEGLRRVAFALDADLDVESAWSGLKLIDVSGMKNPVVLAVTSGSPAAVSGILPGDLLVTVGGAPIQKAADLNAIVSKSRPGDEAVAVVETAGRVHDVKLRYLSTPVVLPLKDPALLYNKAIADLSQTAATSADRVKAAYAWMNIGVALMHFGCYEAAIRDALKKADLPDAAGISKGTIRYLTAGCYEHLGLQNDARTAYLDASASPTATLGSHDGPTLAPSAKRRAAALSSQNKS